MIKIGAWIVVIESGNKYFGYEGEITNYKHNTGWWEVLLAFEDKFIKVNLSTRCIKVIKKEMDGEAKQEIDYLLIKHEIDSALDKRDEKRFYELTEQLKVKQ